MSEPLTRRYSQGPSFDCAVAAGGDVRPEYAAIWDHLSGLGSEGLRRLQQNAELSLRNQGITFAVYGDRRGLEKILPFDLVPRVIAARTWDFIEAGLVQRLRALNLFLADLYGPQRILKDGIVPTDLVVNSPYFCRDAMGTVPAGGVFIHVCGIDLIQDESGVFRVLEDNLRTPSGVSYVVENRRVMGRATPELLQRCGVRPVDTYPNLLLESLRSLSGESDPVVAVMTPGIYNSAYFEHSFLAAEMGVRLVEGRDLVAHDGTLYMKTTRGLLAIDVLYRRVDDAFLDPIAFRPDSLLGVPGLMSCYRAGTLAVANAPGTGVADDKAMYAYVPRVIRYYLGEDPLLPQVPTYLCREENDRGFVLDHLRELVVKPTDGSGGYGLVVGDSASARQLAEIAAAIRARPEHYVAQPIQRLATIPTLIVDDDATRLEPRHVDLRPFAVLGSGGKVTVLPGGLTRVALPRGSLVVNSSQGGGTKDTWVLYGDAHA